MLNRISGSVSFHCEHVFSLTKVQVGAKRERAVLDVEGEVVDIQVAGGDREKRLVIHYMPFVVQVNIRSFWRLVLIHTAKTTGTQTQTQHTSLKSCRNETSIVFHFGSHN